MKNLGKLAILGAVLATSASFAFGSSIQLASYGLTGISSVTGLTTYDPVTGSSPNTLSNSAMAFVGSATYTLFSSVPSIGGPSATLAQLTSLSAYNTTGAGEAYELDPAGVWAAAPTPPASAYVGSTIHSGPYSTSNPAYGYYEYTSVSTLASTYTGSLSVLADDTTEVFLTTSAGTSLLIPFGVLGGDSHCADNVPNCVTIDTVGLALLSGTDTLTFVVEQDGSTNGAGGTGNPSGVAFDATLSTIPEPSSLMLLGTGLLGAGGMLMRRRRVTA